MPSKLTNSFVGLGWFLPFLGVTLFLYFWEHQSILLGGIAAVLAFSASFVLFGLVIQLKDKHKRKQMEFFRTFQPNQDDFRKLKSFTSYDLLAKLAINEQQKKIYFWVPDSTKNIKKAFTGMPYAIKSYDLSDLLAIRLLEDGHQVTFEKRETHYTNYFLNKIGEVEMATNPPVDKIRSMDLEVIVNDTIKPRHTIRFYNEPYRHIQKSLPEYKALSKEAQKWFTLLKGIIHDAEHNVAEENTDGFVRSFMDETFDKSISEDQTQITVHIDPKKYSLHIEEPQFLVSEENLEDMQDEPNQEQVSEKLTSYFEQLLEKNRRQLRGNYTDD